MEKRNEGTNATVLSEFRPPSAAAPERLRLVADSVDGEMWRGDEYRGVAVGDEGAAVFPTHARISTADYLMI